MGTRRELSAQTENTSNLEGHTLCRQQPNAYSRNGHQGILLDALSLIAFKAWRENLMTASFNSAHSAIKIQDGRIAKRYFAT